MPRRSGNHSLTRRNKHPENQKSSKLMKKNETPEPEENQPSEDPHTEGNGNN
jgi:hypothetical protein